MKNSCVQCYFMRSKIGKRRIPQKIYCHLYEKDLILTIGNLCFLDKDVGEYFDNKIAELKG